MYTFTALLFLSELLFHNLFLIFSPAGADRYISDESVAVAKVFPGFTLVQDQAGGRFCGKSSLHSSSEAYFPQKSCRERIPNLSSY